MDATYDGIKAFEINASKNNVSNVADTLKEDVEAAINTFMKSISISFGVEGYNNDYIKQFVPAILFTLYDGYYIYAPTRTARGYEYILQPYNYYSVRYKMNDSNDVVINYSLDNYIVVYGFINGEYWVKSGYLVLPDTSSLDKINIYKNLPIEDNLIKNVPTIGKGATNIVVDSRDVTDEVYDPKYVDKHSTDSRADSFYPRNDYYYVAPDSAQKYYKEAKEFSEWVSNNLYWVTPAYAMSENTPLKDLYASEDFDMSDSFDVGTQIFQFDSSSNDPEDEDSIFFQHKTNVIKASIQSNLNQAITAYSNGGMSETTYDYKLPKLNADEWDMVSTNICMLTFLQGMPVGTKYYNNYALVQSTTNKLYTSKDSLYFTGNDGCYHKIDCPKLDDTKKITGYSNFEFELKSVIKEKRQG